MRPTVATNTFVVIFGVFVCAIAVTGDIDGDVRVVVEDALVGNVGREISSVAAILVVVCRIETMPDVVAKMARGAVHWIMLWLDLLYNDEVLLLNLRTKLKLTAIWLTVVLLLSSS